MPDQDQKNSSRLRRPKGRDWTLAALDRDLAYRLAYNSEANRWDLVVTGPVTSAASSRATPRADQEHPPPGPPDIALRRARREVSTGVWLMPRDGCAALR
jgi:hypothetical protein